MTILTGSSYFKLTFTRPIPNYRRFSSDLFSVILETWAKSIINNFILTIYQVKIKIITLKMVT